MLVGGPWQEQWERPRLTRGECGTCACPRCSGFHGANRQCPPPPPVPVRTPPLTLRECGGPEPPPPAHRDSPGALVAQRTKGKER